MRASVEGRTGTPVGAVGGVAWQQRGLEEMDWKPAGRCWATGGCVGQCKGALSAAVVRAGARPQQAAGG